MMVILSVLMLSSVVFCVASEGASKGCWSAHLSANDTFPPLMMEEILTLRVLPERQVKNLRLQILLEDKDGQPFYDLGLDASMDDHLSDDLVFMDLKSERILLKVSSLPILVPQVWTTMYIRLPHKYLFQFGFVLKEQEDASRKAYDSPFILIPFVASVRLSHHKVSRLTLRIFGGSFLQYAVNCDLDYMSTSLGEEFGIPSTTPVWRSTTWILLAIAIMQLIVIILCIVKKGKPGTATAHFQPGDRVTRAQTTASTGNASGQRPSVDNANSLDVHNVSLGVVSSRAPSPGQELDENTFDYINKAYTNE